MPINKRWPLEELLKACKVFEKTLKPGERFTFEYVMLAGVNDSEEQARQLATCEPSRPESESELDSAQPGRAASLPAFAGRHCGALQSDSGVERHPHIRAAPARPDIFAACGQLAARQESLNTCKEITPSELLNA